MKRRDTNFPKGVYDLAEREKAAHPLGWWWLSFVDADLPKAERFLGVAIVQGHGVGSAAIEADERGVNPGGEVQASELSGAAIPTVELRNRLLSKTELAAAGLIETE